MCVCRRLFVPTLQLKNRDKRTNLNDLHSHRETLQKSFNILKENYQKYIKKAPHYEVKIKAITQLLEVMTSHLWIFSLVVCEKDNFVCA